MKTDAELQQHVMDGAQVGADHSARRRLVLLSRMEW